MKDIEKDRNHPTKSKRPIAAGKIQKRSAVLFTIFLIFLSVVFSALCRNLYSPLLLLLYFIVNVGYSMGLKNIPILDIALLVSGFLIRTLYGALIANIQISNWLYLVIVSMAFYLVLGKRRNELKKIESGDTRSVIKRYSYSFLDSNMHICMALIFVFYALWTVDEKTKAVYHNVELIWTVPIVMLIFMKYSLTVDGNSDGDPVEVLLHDKCLISLSALYLLLMFVLLYVF